MSYVCLADPGTENPLGPSTMKFSFITFAFLLATGTTCAQDREAFQNQSSTAEPAPSANELKAKEHVERARDLL